MNSHLEQQIERIADELSEDRRTSVIVRMESPDDDLRAYLQATSDVIDSRRSVTSARALVPPKRHALRLTPAGNISSAAKKTLQGLDSPSAAAFLASAAIKIIAPAALKAVGLGALTPLLESDWVMELVAQYREKAEGTSQKSVPTHFWSSSSAVLHLTKDELKELPTKVPNVADIYPNRIVKVPPVFKAQEPPAAVVDNKAYTWGLSKTGALATWGVFGAKGGSVRVAIIDSGVDPQHPDLKGKIAGFAEFGRSGEKVSDGLDNAKDSGDHGTHCAGTIVGGKASSRWIGMAPEAKILAAMVLTSDKPDGPIYGTDAQILAGLEWALSNEADVISLSLGGLRLSSDVLDTYTRAIINANRLGIPVVVAVGNDGSQTSGSPGNDYFAFTVGATDVQDRAAGFSGGRTQIIEESRFIDREYLPVVYSKPDVSAPGVDVYSSVPGGKWETMSGTSMATPHVAGAIALLLSKQTTIMQLGGLQRVSFLQNLLTSTVQEFGESGQNHRFGYGRIDVLRAFGYAQELGYIE
jgi:subtilisin family serine protease